MALSVEGKAAAVLIFTGIVAPAIGLGLKRLTRGWDNYGAGPFAIHRDPPGKDEGLGARARLGESPFDENEVEALFQNVTTTLRTSPPLRARAKASAARASGTRCVTMPAARTTPRSMSASASRRSRAPQE